jgi:NADH-quinone oxidoreductase subunit N
MNAVTTADLAIAAPEISLLAAICIVLLVDLFLTDRTRVVTYLLSLVALAVVAIVTVTEPDGRAYAFHAMYVSDMVGRIVKLVACGAVATTFLYSRDFLIARGLFRGEFYVLGLFATLGIFVIASAASLLTAYLGIEVLALSLYGLVACDRDSKVAAESAMKYFTLGAIASGTLLYGISIIYGVTGTFSLTDLAGGLHPDAARNVGVLFGLAFLVAGIGFKFGAVPFHMWVPDVYHGAPSAVTLFLGTGPKLAYFALAFRVLAEGLGGAVDAWRETLLVLAVLSVAVGSLVGVVQTNLKRLLAYSTIANVGFILLAILTGSSTGYRAALFYTISYVLMALGSFAMILMLARADFEGDRIDDFRGLAQKSPWFAWMMLFLMVSTAGVPPFIGFFAKLYVLQALVDAGLTWVALVALAFSVVAAFYYLRVVKAMFFDEPPEVAVPLSGNGAMRFVLSLNAIAVLALGVFSTALIAAIARALP